MTDPTASPFSAVAGYPDQVINPGFVPAVWQTDDTTARVSWPAMPGVLYYNVFFSVSPRTPRLIASEITDLQYIVTNLTPSSRYYAQVVGYIDPSRSVSSLQVQVQTTPPPPLPPIPPNVLLNYNGLPLTSFSGSLLVNGS